MELFAFASRPHYAAHMWPIVQELENRGHTVTLAKYPNIMPEPEDLCLVASAADMETMGGRRLIYVEHGAGQTYVGVTGPGYPGGTGHEDCVAFVCPSERVGDLWAARYPDAEIIVAGCPMLDKYHTFEYDAPDPDRPILGVTFHWPSSLVDETLPAWPVYQYAFDGLIRECLKHGWGLLGHEHPRWDQQLNLTWRTRNVPEVTYKDVMERATLLIADNTSMIPEFASTGRPVLFLNSPQYRRDVNHGGRFYEWPQGQVSCDDPSDLIESVKAALLDPPEVQEARKTMVSNVYAFTDGSASSRAADAIERMILT